MSLRVDLVNAQTGDCAVVRRRGFTGWFFGSLLKLFVPGWSGWGWHTGILWQELHDGWLVFEALGSGVTQTHYTQQCLEDDCRVYRWLNDAPSEDQLVKFQSGHTGKRYDIAIYFWTTLAVLIRHYINRPIPRLLDNRFSCWELVQEFYEEMGKPVVSKYDVILLPDLLRAFGEF